jgi:hypothetical protein
MFMFRNGQRFTWLSAARFVWAISNTRRWVWTRGVITHAPRSLSSWSTPDNAKWWVWNARKIEKWLINKVHNHQNLVFQVKIGGYMSFQKILKKNFFENFSDGWPAPLTVAPKILWSPVALLVWLLQRLCLNFYYVIDLPRNYFINGGTTMWWFKTHNSDHCCICYCLSWSVIDRNCCF